MSLKRIFGLMVLFLLFEAAIAFVTALAGHSENALLACAAMTVLAMVVWLGFTLLRHLMKKRAAEKVTVERTQPTPAAEDSLVQELRALLAEANRRLAGMFPQQARQRPAKVTDLPLYLVLGAEGSGKTSAILNSGMEARLLAGEAAREGTTLPTKLANIWLADKSIFVDISGHVLMQDADRWQAMLHVLSEQEHRPFWKKIAQDAPSRPGLRGVVLACSTQGFLRSPDVQRLNSAARTLNERLQAVRSVFSQQFPVYVLLTCCDSVQCFPEFAAHLSEAETRHPLGTTLPMPKFTIDSVDVYSEREARRITGFLNRLYQSLADSRVVLLPREEDPGKRALGYEFPRELKKLRGDLVQFLLDVFRPAGLRPEFCLRGFYFSGMRLVARGRSELEMTSSPANSVAFRSTDASVFFSARNNPPADDGSVLPRRNVLSSVTPKFAFLHEVFREIILKDPAGSAPPEIPRPEQKYRDIGFAVAGGLCLVLAVLWTTSWANNHRLLKSAQAAVQAVHSGTNPSGDEALMELESTRPLLVQLHSDSLHGAPWSYRWGLYAGDDAEIAMDRVYFQRFRQELLGPVLGLMTDRLLALQPNTPAGFDVGMLLKSYRGITSRSCAPDDRALLSTVFPMWRSAVSPDPEMARVAEKQVSFYLSELKIADPYARLGEQLPENREAVARAQNYLRDLGGPDKILRALLSQVDQKQPAERLSDYAGTYTQVMSGPDELDAAYTSHGWIAVQDSIQGHKLATAGEPCLVGSSGGVATWAADGATDTAVEQLYNDDYVRQWKDFLDAHHVLPFNGTIDASQKLRVLADNNRSPLLALVYMTSMNTNVSPPHTVTDQLSSGLHAAAQGTEKSVQDLLQKVSGKGASGQTAAPANTGQPDTVLSEFEPAHIMVNPGMRDKWLSDKNQGYMKSLEALSTALAALPSRVDSSSQTDMQTLDRASQAVANANMELHTLQGAFPNTPQGIDITLKNLLQEPISYADKAIHGVAVYKPAPVPAPGAGAAPAPGGPPPPSAHELAKGTIEQVNRSGHDLCLTVESVQTKFPFDATSTEDASLEDVDQVFRPGNGSLARFTASPEVSKAYTRQGKAWTGKPDFPATFSEPFLEALNNMAQVEDALYAEGAVRAHFEYTITLDGTGNIPFELDVDGHVIKYTPGKPGTPTRLAWPPQTNSPTRLVVKTSAKGGLSLPAQNAGSWSLFHLLQAADDQSGNVFTFRAVEFAHSHVPLMNSKGTPGTLQIRVDSPAGDVFGRGYFNKLRCESTWALH